MGWWNGPRRRGVAGLAVLLTTGGLVLPASAPASAATAGYKLTYTRLPDGRSVALRWNPCQSAITYRVNVSAVPRSWRSAALSQTRTAVTRLAAATRMRLSYRGTTSAVPRTGNLASLPAELVIAYTTPSRTDLGIGGTTIGMGGTLWSHWSITGNGAPRYGAAVVRGYVVLDVTTMSRLRRGFGSGQTQGNALLHELGHAVGLDHTTDRRQLMYPELASGTPNGFAAGDRAGLAKLGRSAGCLSIPAGLSPGDLR